MKIDLFDPTIVHVLPDFEMLGPGDRAKVIGVGASVFGLADGVGYARLAYEAWPITLLRQDDRSHTWDTVAWWSQQVPAVRDVAFRAMDGRGASSGKPLRLAVKELVDAALQLARDAKGLRLQDEAEGETWRRVVWWAKPAAADLSLWMDLLREFRPDMALLYGRVRDVGTLQDAVRAATGTEIDEEARGPDEVHVPGSDSLTSARACARCLEALHAHRGQS